MSVVSVDKLIAEPLNGFLVESYFNTAHILDLAAVSKHWQFRSSRVAAVRSAV